MRMQTANRGSQDMAGCSEMLEIDVEGIKTWAHAYVVPDTPYWLLLGQPWQKLVHLLKSEDIDNVYITVQDPINSSNVRTIATSPWPWLHHRTFTLTAALISDPSLHDTSSIPPKSSLTSSSFVNQLLQETFDFNPLCWAFAYKKVMNKVKLVATTMPAHAWIVRIFPEDPLLTLPPVLSTPPEFVPGKQLTQQCMDELGIFQNEFLLLEEQKLAAQVLKNHKLALAWDESEKGRFHDDYFPPIIIPTIEHIPWTHHQPPIPPGIKDEVIKLNKPKIASGVYEASNGSYQSWWFCVAKKNGSVCIIHDLQQLNSVTFKDAATMPYIKHSTEQCAGCAIYTMMDLFIGFNHHALAEESHDVTTFQTPLGTFHLTVLPQGWTDSLAIFQNDVAFILQAEIEIAPNFQDDVNILGPHTRYELADGTYETLPDNEGIQ
jgi:hypothetical protein